MLDRAELLRTFIRSARTVPVIGVDDCGPWVVRWVQEASGRRIEFPNYKTADEGYALSTGAGGLARLVAPLLYAAGIWEVASPVLGDIGVVSLHSRDVPVIFLERGYVVVRCEGPGVRIIRPSSFEKAWAVP